MSSFERNRQWFKKNFSHQINMVGKTAGQKSKRRKFDVYIPIRTKEAVYWIGTAEYYPVNFTFGIVTA